MNVLQVYKTRYPEVAGGVDTVVSGLLRASPEQFRARLLETAAWTVRGRVDREVDGVAVHALHLPLPGRGRAMLAFLWRAPYALWTLYRLVREAAIDVIHLHTLQHYHLYFVLLRWFGGPPYIVTLHRAEVLAYPERETTTRWIWRRTLVEAAAVVAVSGWLAERARGAFPQLSRVEVIHNGIAMPSAECSESMSAMRKDLPTRYCVMIGACTAYKGHETAIRAWALLPARHVDVGLVVIGSGELEARYRSLAAELGLSARMTLAGHLPQAEAFALARHSQALLMPSRNEGFGLALLEAAARGVPVVCSDIEPFRELLEDEVTALLFQVDDAASLARAVQRVLDDPALRTRLSANAAAHVRARFPLSRMQGDYAGLYRVATTGR